VELNVLERLEALEKEVSAQYQDITRLEFICFMLYEIHKESFGSDAIKTEIEEKMKYFCEKLKKGGT